MSYPHIFQKKVYRFKNIAMKGCMLVDMRYKSYRHQRLFQRLIYKFLQSYEIKMLRHLENVD